jgi:hypothetical protein
LILICVLVWYFCYRKRNQDHDENFSIIIGGSEVLHTNDYTNTSMSIPDSNPASTDITIDIPDKGTSSGFKSVKINQGDDVRKFLDGMNTTTTMSDGTVILKVLPPKLNDEQQAIITQIKSYHEGLDDQLDGIVDMLQGSDSALLKTLTEEMSEIKSKEDVEKFLQWANDKVSDSHSVQSLGPILNPIEPTTAEPTTTTPSSVEPSFDPEGKPITKS